MHRLLSQIVKERHNIAMLGAILIVLEQLSHLKILSGRIYRDLPLDFGGEGKLQAERNPIFVRI